MAPFSDYAISPEAYPTGGAGGIPDPPPLSPHGSEIGPVREVSPTKSRRTKGSKRAAGTQPVGSDALSNPTSTPVIDPKDRQSARELLADIGRRFAENRQKSKSKAFEIYQRDLAENSGTLVMGGAVTLKELSVLLMDLEDFMKSTLKEGTSPAEMLAQFLRGELIVDE